MSNPVSAIANAITEGFRLLGQYLKGAVSRRKSRAIEYGERFIRRYESITPEEKRDRYLVKYAEYFFKYNN